MTLVLLNRLALLVTSVACSPSVASTTVGSAEAQPDSPKPDRPEGTSERSMAVIDIFPNRSIGPVLLGAKQDALPSSSKIVDGVGHLDSIRFLIVGGVVDDIWIEGLETKKHRITVDSKPLPITSDLGKLEGVVGACTKLTDVIGGTFYNCKSGVSIGFNTEGKLSQIRVKAR